MNNHVTHHDGHAVVFVKDGTVFTTSREVAEKFGKRHDNVLRAITSLECSPNFLSLNFEEKSVGNTGGRPAQVYHMTRDGLMFLAMGFTGKDAALWKERFVAAFNAMENEVRNRPTQIDVRDPGQLANIAIQLIEVNKELQARASSAEAQVEAAKPKTEFFDQFIDSDGLYGLQNAARVLNEPPNGFVAWLRQEYLFSQGKYLVPRKIYSDQGLFVVKAAMWEGKARPRTYVTPKGLRYLAKKLGKQIERDLFSPKPH